MNDQDDQNWYDKIRKIAGKLGFVLLTSALTAAELVKDPAVPKKAKAAIVGSLGYLISPIDFIPDILPAGYTDDLSVIAWALSSVAVFTKVRHVRAAHEKMEQWGFSVIRPVPSELANDSSAAIYLRELLKARGRDDD